MNAVHAGHKLRNMLHTVLLLGGMMLLFALLGAALLGVDGMVMMVLISMGVAALTPRASPWLTLRIYRAVPLPYESMPALHDITGQLARSAGLPDVPLLFYVPSAGLNAFAMQAGKEPLIAVTDGLLRNLNRRELTGVLAHEISHIRNGDLGVMMLADMLSRMTAALALAGKIMLLVFLPLFLLGGAHLPWLAVLLLFFAPGISALMQMALSRSREFDADLDAARLTGDPLGLASALAKIEPAAPWWQRLLFPGRESAGPSLLRTHPATEERIARLRELAASQPEAVHVAEWVPVPDAFHAVHDPRRRHWLGIWY